MPKLDEPTSQYSACNSFPSRRLLCGADCFFSQLWSPRRRVNRSLFRRQGSWTPHEDESSHSSQVSELNIGDRNQWPQHAAGLIRSEHQPEIGQACRQAARSNGFYEELARAILVHDISVSLVSFFWLLNSLIGLIHRCPLPRFEQN